MKQEIEILFELNEDPRTAIGKLQGCKLKGVKHIIDTYYIDPLRDTLKPSKTGRLFSCFRLRETTDKSFITYKIDYFEGENWLYSDESETVISDVAVTKDIFAKLGLEVLVVVDNTRTVVSNETFEIAIEDVKGLGSFIEVEYHQTDEIDDVLVAKQHIRDFLKAMKIKIGDEMNAGKPELLLRKG